MASCQIKSELLQIIAFAMLAGSAVALPVDSHNDRTSVGQVSHQHTTRFTFPAHAVCEGCGPVRQSRLVADNNDLLAAVDEDLQLMFWLKVLNGHLRAGQTLMHSGDVAGAEHIGQPRSEILTVIEPLLEAGYRTGLAEQFIDLEIHAARKGSDHVFTEKLHALHEKPDVLEATIDADKRENPAFNLKIAHLMLRSVTSEYDVAWRGSKLVNQIEYQDAWAFTGIATDLLDQHGKSISLSHPVEFANMKAAIANLQSALPGIMAPKRPVAPAAVLHAAVALFEINLNRVFPGS
jgi:hypothetical protein